MAEHIVKDFAHSRRIPLSVLVEALERDQYLIEKALCILSVEEPEGTYTEVSAVPGLLNHWLVNRELGYYISGKPGNDITALTVLSVDGDYGKGLDALEDWITIDKEELVGLLKSLNLTVPDCLIDANDHTPSEERIALPEPIAQTALNIFHAMDGLKWTDITMTFTELEAVRIRARGEIGTFGYEAMGFKNRKSLMAEPNQCWETFRCLAIVSTFNKTWNDVSPATLKKRISQLRDQLQRFFGIADDPIAYRKGVGYEAAFNLQADAHAIQAVRERRTASADEDEEEDIQRVMSEEPYRKSR